MASPSLRRLLRFLPLAALGLALAAPSASASPADFDRPFLWRIDGGAEPSYLFGTIHAGVNASELHPIVDSALHQSRIFVMETAPSGPVANQNRAALLPMDLVLGQHARDIGKSVATLETVEFQLALLAELGGGGPEQYAAMLANDPDALTSLVAAYRSGDIEQIAKVSQADDLRTQELLLDKRNHRWMHKLEAPLRRGGVFAAVGVGHAPGPQGLLELLRQRGYQTRQFVG